MTDEKESERVRPTNEQSVPRCPVCAAFAHLTAKLLDSRSGRTVRLFQCQCGERVWDD